MDRSISVLDTPLDSWIHRPPARGLARLLNKTLITPNSITLFNLVPAVISAWLFKRGNFHEMLGGCIFFYCWSVLDHVDGELARIKNRSCQFGEKLDDLCDVIGSSLILFGIFLGILPFWSEKDAAAFTNIFLIGFFLNTATSILMVKKRKKDPGEKWLNHFTGRDPFYILLLLVLVTLALGGAFWYSFTLAALLGGQYLVAAVSIGKVLLFKCKIEPSSL